MPSDRSHNPRIHPEGERFEACRCPYPPELFPHYSAGSCTGLQGLLCAVTSIRIHFGTQFCFLTCSKNVYQGKMTFECAAFFFDVSFSLSTLLCFLPAAWYHWLWRAHCCHRPYIFLQANLNPPFENINVVWSFSKKRKKKDQTRLFSVSFIPIRGKDEPRQIFWCAAQP